MLKKIYLLLTSQRITNSILAIIAIFTVIALFRIGFRSDLTAKFDREIFIGQRMGELRFYHSISVKNIGKETGFITKIKGYIRSKESDRLTFNRKLESGDYFDEKTNKYKPFLEIPLVPDEAFSSELTLTNKLGRFDQDSINILHSKMADEADAASDRGIDLRTRNASKKLAKLIEYFISSRIKDLKQGEYEYIIELFSERNVNNPFVYKCYSFTLYDSNIKLLKESIKPYQRIVQSPLNTFNRPNIQVYLTEITNPETIASLLKAVNN